MTHRDTVSPVLGRILAVGLATLAGCYSPPQPDCGFSCTRNGECPADYTCASDGVCHRNGSPANLVCAVDARIDTPRPIDAPPPDADTTPPMVFATMPANGETNVATSAVVRVQFDEPVLTVDVSTFTLDSAGTPIAGGITQVDPYTYTFIPTPELPAGATIEVTLTSDITDMSLNPLAMTTFSFGTAP